jgi:cell division protease FtsH
MLVTCVIIFVNVLLSPAQNQNQEDAVASVVYSDVLNAADQGRIAKVVIGGEGIVRGVFTDGKEFRSYTVDAGEMASRLADKGVKVEVLPPRKTPWWASHMTSRILILLLMGTWSIILYILYKKRIQK